MSGEGGSRPGTGAGWQLEETQVAERSEQGDWGDAAGDAARGQILQGDMVRPLNSLLGTTGQEVNSTLQGIWPALQLLVLFNQELLWPELLVPWLRDEALFPKSPLGKGIAEAARKLPRHCCVPARAEDPDKGRTPAGWRGRRGMESYGFPGPAVRP